MGLFDKETIYDFFIVAVSYLKDVWAYWFSINVPRIQKVSLVYTRDYSKKVPEFVNNLLSAHDYEDVTLEYRIGGAKNVLKDMSPDVTDYFFEILYKVHSKEYVYLTRNPDHVFPPPRPQLSFRLPVQEAFLIDSKGVAVFNITKQVKLYEGPNLDFHGETIRLRDLDIDEPECTGVRFVSVVGKVVEYSLADDSISHQTIWSPGKTSTLQDWQHCTLERETDSPPPA